MAPSGSLTSPANQGTLSIFAYCFSSILMVVTNKYVLSGLDYNLNFLLLAVQVGALSSARALLIAAVHRLRRRHTKLQELRRHPVPRL
jgi:hypothetical protein